MTIQLAGIYIHIPFCRQACHYCDFHFSTNLKTVNEMHSAILNELELRKSYLEGQTINTIYFGGGTPSIFTVDQIEGILNAIYSAYKVTLKPEITLEANPDDLSNSFSDELIRTSVNRLSIGIQTFDNSRLAFLNRKHTSEEAASALVNALKAGFENITADLIMGIPPEDDRYWKSDLEQLVSYDLPHISIYSLTVEEKTTLGNWKRKGRFSEVSEDSMAGQFEFTIDFLESMGYNHYEVSNYAKPGFESKHNSAYWSGESYLGIGPGAHSYNGELRSYNMEHNPSYIKALKAGVVPQTVEVLSTVQRMNEFLLTGLRTKNGIRPGEFEQLFSRDLLSDREVELERMMLKKWLEFDGSILRPTKKGLLMADEITLRLFYDSE